MHKNTAKKHNHRTGLHLHNDYENIKSILVGTTQDLKGRAGEILSHSVENVKDKSTDVKDGIETYVTKKPFQSIGIAVVAGIALGYFMHK